MSDDGADEGAVEEAVEALDVDDGTPTEETEQPDADGSMSGESADDATPSDNSSDATEEPEETRSDGRETVQVYARENLVNAWKLEAEQAKLTLSEYVVRMIEAGRMSVRMEPAQPDSEATAMTVEQIRDEVLTQLQAEEYVTWEQLVETLSRNLEENVEQALRELQEDGSVRYSGLRGGYELIDNSDD